MKTGAGLDRNGSGTSRQTVSAGDGGTADPVSCSILPVQSCVMLRSIMASNVAVSSATA